MRFAEALSQKGVVLEMDATPSVSPSEQPAAEMLPKREGATIEHAIYIPAPSEAVNSWEEELGDWDTESNAGNEDEMNDAGVAGASAEMEATPSVSPGELPGMDATPSVSPGELSLNLFKGSPGAETAENAVNHYGIQATESLCEHLEQKQCVATARALQER